MSNIYEPSYTVERVADRTLTKFRITSVMLWVFCCAIYHHEKTETVVERLSAPVCTVSVS